MDFSFRDTFRWGRQRWRDRQSHAVWCYLPPFLLALLTLTLLGAATWVVTWPTDGLGWLLSEGRILSVETGGPGALAGPRPGDVVLAVDDRSLADVPLYAGYRAGQIVVLTVRRGGEIQDITLTLAAPDGTDLLWRSIPIAVALAFWGATVVVFLLLMLIPLSHAYVIVQHDLSPLDRFFNRSLVVFILGLLWAALYLGGVGLGMMLFRDTPLLQPLVGALVTMGLAAAFTPLRRWIQRIVDRLFYGGWYDYRTVVAQVSHALGGVTSRQELAERLLGPVVEGLRLRGAALYLRAPGGGLALEGCLGLEVPERLAGEAFTLTITPVEGGFFVGPHRPMLKHPPKSTPESTPPQEGVGEDIAWSLPLVREGRLLGYLLLGEKREDDFFEPADEEILRTLGEQAALAAENVLLMDDLRQALAALEMAQRRLLTAREEERRVLAWELHDGPVQDLLALGYRLYECRERAWRHEPVLAERLEEVRGVVRVCPHTVATGVKIFCLGDLPSDLWTDDGSRYFELWGGLTPTFWDYRTLQPGASVAWTEHWYPVSGSGGYNWANEEAAIRLTPSGEGAEVAVATSRALNGTVVLRRGGVEVQWWEAFIAPGQPFRAPPFIPPNGGERGGEGDWGVQVLTGGSVIARMGP